MGILGFHNIISTEDVSLKGSAVFDGKNFFYNLYEHYKLPYAYGCECDSFAKYVKKYLTMFKEANVDCYFIFKGGNIDFEKYLQIHESKEKSEKENLSNQTFINPLFADEIIKEVLDDMKFKYVSCQYEAKDTCIALAQYLACPVVSYDRDFAFTKSNIDYIPNRIDVRNSSNNIKHINGEIKCGVFNLEKFMNKINITEDNFILFIVLTDTSILPQDYFINFFNKIKSPKGTFYRNQYLLHWLLNKDSDSVKDQIIKLNVDEKRFNDALTSVKNFLYREVNGGLPLQYVWGKVEIDNLDPEWFEKGVILQHIHISYVNIYRSKMVVASNKIQDCAQPNALMLSLKIIKYAYDLLTNFSGEEIKITSFSNLKQLLPINVSIEKPHYDCRTCVFENGWKNIRSLNLFQHFISVTLETFDFSLLESAPEDARLLLIALVYFSRQKAGDTSNETLSILMSYLLLSNNTSEYSNVEYGKAKQRALHLLKKYFTSKKDIDFKVLHPLTEFQHCLHELNKLNILCGQPYKPTLYSKTYNGTFVYNFLLYLMNNDGIESIKNILYDNKIVLDSLNSLWNIIKILE